MANIDTYLQAIMAAIYGRDVRQSIHDAIQAINEDVDGFVRGELDTTLTSTTLPAQGKAVGDAVGALKSALIYKYSTSRWRNGSVFNKNNINAISTNEIIDVENSKHVILRCNIPLQTNYLYRWQFTTYSVKSGIAYDNDAYSVRREKTFYTTSTDVIININDEEKGFAVALYISNNDASAYIPLRIETVDLAELSIEKNPTWYENRNAKDIDAVRNDLMPVLATTTAKARLVIGETDLIDGYIDGFTGEYVNGVANSGLCFCTANYISVDGAPALATDSLSDRFKKINIVEYDANKQFIHGVLIDNNTKRILTLNTSTRYVKFSFTNNTNIEDECAIYELFANTGLGSFIRPASWRNGSVGNLYNEYAITHRFIIDNMAAASVIIYVNRPLTTGHKYKFVYSTYSISEGNAFENNDKRVSIDRTYTSNSSFCEIQLQDGSLGFAFGLFEMDENDANVPLRIETFDTEQIYVERRYNPYECYQTKQIRRDTTAIDLNDFVDNGFYAFGNGVTFVNAPDDMPPINDTTYVLKSFNLYNGPGNNKPGYHELIQLKTGLKYLRYRWGDGTWQRWTRDEYGLDGRSVLFTSPVLSKFKFDNYISALKPNQQDIAVYNGHIFSFGNGVVSIDGSENISIDCGHGNNAMFGKNLHGVFPYLYCGSWDFDDNYITINEVTLTSATLVRKIEFPTLTGHLNMCVDEENNKIYILMNKNSSSHVGDINFVVADLLTGTIISQTDLDYAIPVIQGMEFHNGNIFVTHGGVSPNSDNFISILDTTGQRISKSEPIDGMGEIEGISFDGGKIYIANLDNIWSTII